MGTKKLRCFIFVLNVISIASSTRLEVFQCHKNDYKENSRKKGRKKPPNLDRFSANL